MLFGVQLAVTLESNRMLGGVGALLSVVSSAASFLSLAQFFIPSMYTAGFGGFLGLLGIAGFAGLILFMVAMNGLASYYKDRSIFNNALYWIITCIIEAVVAVGLVFVVVLSVLSRIIGTLSSFTAANPPTFSSLLDILQPYIGYFIPVGVVVFAIAVVAVVFLMRAFNRLAVASGVQLFKTVGLLFLAGAALSGALVLLAALLVSVGLVTFGSVLPLIVVSGLVNFAAWVLASMAFFRIRAPASPQTFPQTAPQTVTPAVGQVKYCPYCGAENMVDAIFCARCGKKL
jgi:uncharacterized membrane protein